MDNICLCFSFRFNWGQVSGLEGGSIDPRVEIASNADIVFLKVIKPGMFSPYT